MTGARSLADRARYFRGARRLVLQEGRRAGTEQRGGRGSQSISNRPLLNPSPYRRGLFSCANRYYLVDVLRGRFDYPTLKARVVSHAKQHKPCKILIEDAGVGTALIQDLKKASLSVVPIKPEYDKKIRMAIQSAKFESGRVLFPKQASWLADLELELFAFPRGRHDDQVDSISQALGHKPASGWTPGDTGRRQYAPVGYCLPLNCRAIGCPAGATRRFTPPELIAGWLKAGNERRLRAVGCETIYAFIYRAAQKAEQLWRYLTRGDTSK